MIFDLAVMIGEMKAEPTWQRATRNAVTLCKEHGLRAVLVTMHGGTTIPEHAAEGPVAIHVLEGRLRLRAASRDVLVGPGRLVTLQAGTPHRVDALEDAAFLLTLAACAPGGPATRPLASGARCR